METLTELLERGPSIPARVLSNWYPIEEGIELYGSTYDSSEHFWQAIKYHPDTTVTDLNDLLSIFEHKDWRPGCRASTKTQSCICLTPTRLSSCVTTSAPSVSAGFAISWQPVVCTLAIEPGLSSNAGNNPAGRQSTLPPTLPSASPRLKRRSYGGFGRFVSARLPVLSIG